jgi:hypothetical protein
MLVFCFSCLVFPYFLSGWFSNITCSNRNPVSTVPDKPCFKSRRVDRHFVTVRIVNTDIMVFDFRNFRVFGRFSSFGRIFSTVVSRLDGRAQGFIGTWVQFDPYRSSLNPRDRTMTQFAAKTRMYPPQDGAAAEPSTPECVSVTMGQAVYIVACRTPTKAARSAASLFATESKNKIRILEQKQPFLDLESPAPHAVPFPPRSPAAGFRAMIPSPLREPKRVPPANSGTVNARGVHGCTTE